jgi:hypothetical protein
MVVNSPFLRLKVPATSSYASNSKKNVPHMLSCRHRRRQKNPPKNPQKGRNLTRGPRSLPFPRDQRRPPSLDVHDYNDRSQHLQNTDRYGTLEVLSRLANDLSAAFAIYFLGMKYGSFDQVNIAVSFLLDIFITAGQKKRNHVLSMSHAATLCILSYKVTLDSIKDVHPTSCVSYICVVRAYLFRSFLNHFLTHLDCILVDPTLMTGAELAAIADAVKVFKPKQYHHHIRAEIEKHVAANNKRLNKEDDLAKPRYTSSELKTLIGVLAQRPGAGKTRYESYWEWISISVVDRIENLYLETTDPSFIHKFQVVTFLIRDAGILALLPVAASMVEKLSKDDIQSSIPTEKLADMGSILVDIGVASLSIEHFASVGDVLPVAFRKWRRAVINKATYHMLPANDFAKFQAVEDRIRSLYYDLSKYTCSRAVIYSKILFYYYKNNHQILFSFHLSRRC